MFCSGSYQVYTCVALMGGLMLISTVSGRMMVLKISCTPFSSGASACHRWFGADKAWQRSDIESVLARFTQTATTAAGQSRISYHNRNVCPKGRSESGCRTSVLSPSCQLNPPVTCKPAPAVTERAASVLILSMGWLKVTVIGVEGAICLPSGPKLVTTGSVVVKANVYGSASGLSPNR